MPDRSRKSAEKAEIDMGTSCMFSGRFWAVTTISSICANAVPAASKQTEHIDPMIETDASLRIPLPLRECFV
jgi:hypothetical protein